jgi:PHP family Zn ribbon phosphoesterase
MSDLPRKELIRRAESLMWKAAEQGAEIEIYFKFTCEACGERCTLNDVNTLYEKGECAKCGHITTIEKGGFMVQFNVYKGDWNEWKKN